MAIVYNPNAITNGLIVYLDAANKKSYSGSGTSWLDISGNNNNATITGSQFVNGSSGQSYIQSVNTTTLFYISIPNSTSIQSAFTTTSTGWTIEETIWTNPIIYPHADAAGGSTSGAAFVPGGTGFEWNQGSGTTQFWFGQSNNNPNVSNAYQDSGFISVASPYNSTGAWRIRTMIWNRSNNTNYLYINGNLIGSVLMSGTAGKSIYNNDGLTLGTNHGWYHDGNRSTIKIYNRVLSYDEIQQSYTSFRGRYGL